MGVTETIIRTFLSFLTLSILMRIMERKEISEITFFNFASAIAIGSVAGNLAFNKDLSILNGIISLIGWSVLTTLSGRIIMKSRKARKLIDGEPLIIVQNGKIMEKPLRKVQLDIDALTALLRQKDIFSITEVEYAIFETTGKLSVMKKDNKQSVTKGDMSVINPQKQLLPTITEVVSDGVINTNNLEKLNLSTEWLNKQLSQAGIETISDVLYAEVQPDHTLYIDSKKDNLS
ncbi:DUF421 domain-containing protein [Domibacillus robiginosus]|uniref:DUF421 domain-containing protein n=1 Tax=Domibacillus robiginosus TaxID=1071054 RepID=UPI00067E25AF|nr:DUF421 domain-containing protein [Domibacillus robiginosus]